MNFGNFFNKDKFNNGIAFGKVVEETPTATEKKDEWVWVEGYKGTNSDMTCNGFQYELGKQHDMPEDEKIKICESGFHFCQRLRDVYSHYGIGQGHRFFQVRALVRQADLDEIERMRKSPSLTWSNMLSFSGKSTDKLTSKSIIFERELTIDEILEATDHDTSDFTDEEKHLAVTEGIHFVHCNRRKEEEKRQVQALVSLGYSDAFAMYIVKRDWYEEAYAVGTQSDLSMDMKVLVILQQHLDD